MHGSSALIAAESFEKAVNRNATSWNALLSAYAQKGDFLRTRKTFRRMPQRNVEAFIWISIAYVADGKLLRAQKIFDQTPHKDVWAWNTIIAAHAYKGNLLDAKLMFKRMPKRSAGSWKGLVAAYICKDKIQKARHIFRKAPPVCRATPELWDMIIQGYAAEGLCEEAKRLFERTPERTSKTWATLIECYVKSGQVGHAESLLSISPPLEVPAWVTIVRAFGRRGEFEKALRLFNSCRISPETWEAMLEVCCEKREMGLAKQVFDAMPARSLMAWESMFALSLKAKRTVEEVRKLFDGMPLRSAECWASMIDVYARLGHSREAFEMFKAMDLDGFRADHNTYTTALFVCPGEKEKQTVRRAMGMSRQQLQRNRPAQKNKIELV